MEGQSVLLGPRPTQAIVSECKKYAMRDVLWCLARMPCWGMLQQGTATLRLIASMLGQPKYEGFVRFTAGHPSGIADVRV